MEHAPSNETEVGSAAEVRVGTTSPEPVPATAPDVWGWWTTAQQNVQQFAETAKRVAKEKAEELSKKAEEMRQNYDMDVATSIIMGTVGGPIDPSGQSNVRKKKLTRQALQDLDLTYITENMISMSFPSDLDSDIPGNRSGNDIDVVAAFLKKRHAGHFMIWNISEEAYDYDKFSDQVLEYKFPGHPAPPLGLLFKICTSVESWLDADERNISVIHCLTGKGRTATLMACVLTWIGEFTSPMEALQYISERRKINVDFLTIPSQRRYIQYFSNMLDGVKPRSEPLLLRRVIINNIPAFGTDAEEGGNEGCCPYVQLFKNGRLIATAAAQGGSTGSSSGSGGGSGGGNEKMQLRWVKTSDGSASFNIDCVLQGDLLLRCRHVARSGVRVSMFRCGFHTGYVPSGVLRLTKAQLDGSNADPRFDDDFFVDLIFAPIGAVAAEDINTSPTVPVVAAASAAGNSAEGAGADASTGTVEAPTAPSDAGLTVEATSTDRFEMTLHKDAKFWESISNRKQKAKRRKSRKFVSNQQEQFSIGDDELGDGGTEVNFYANFIGSTSSSKDNVATGGAAGATTIGSSAGNSNNSNAGLSDMDLISQLAELENDSIRSRDDSTGNSSSHSSGVAASDNSEAKKQYHEAGSSILMAGSSASPAACGADTTGSSSSISKTATNELQALEELEKELGLDNFALFSSNAYGASSAEQTGANAPAPETADSTVAVAMTSTSNSAAGNDDDLDELEQYLQSLAPK